MIVNTNPDFYKLFKSCVRWRDPSHTPAFLIIIIHEGGKPVKSETGFFWGEGVFFRCRLDLPLLYPMRGACPTGRRLTLPLWCPQGGLPSLPPATPAVSCLGRPHPPSPLPGGKGETKSLFRRGYRPRHPGIKPSTALTAPATQAPLRGSVLFSTRIPVAPVCAIALFNSTPKELVFHKQSQCRVPIQPGDARGEAPCIRKLKVSPFPPGRGLGGWGRQRQLTAGAAGDKEGKPPLRTPQRQGQPATSPSRAPQVPQTPAEPVPPGFKPGDARGEAPCMK